MRGTARGGLKIYLMKTKMGAFLASTWQIALLAAILLWLPVVIVLLVRLSRRAKGRTCCLPRPCLSVPLQPRQNPRAASVTAAVPVQPTAPMEETVLIQPTAPVEETELIARPGGGDGIDSTHRPDGGRC